ncbi:Os07g0501133, partial [Oryza sativa Japonica Group]
AAQLVEHEDHRGAAHVAVLAQHLPARRHGAVVQPERLLDEVQDPSATRVDGPEEVPPPGGDADGAERVGQAPLDAAGEHLRHAAADVVVHAALLVLHGDGALAVRDGGLRRERHLEQRALDGADRVGADDDGARAVAEQRLPDDGVVAPHLGPVERDERGLGAGDEDARAAVVLGELLGELQRPAAAVAAVEAEHGARHGGAEAEERRQQAVAAGRLDAGVGAEDEVGDVGGRPAPLGDRLRRGGRGELRHDLGDDLHPGVE